MLVMDVVVIMSVMIVSVPVIVIRHMGVGMRMTVIVMFVVMMIVTRAAMIVVAGERHRGHGLRHLQRANEAATLGPDQPRAERRDQGIT